MKFLIVSILLATFSLSSCSELQACINHCRMNEDTAVYRQRCVLNCYQEATGGGYRTDNYGECADFCKRWVYEEYKKDCKKACRHFFPKDETRSKKPTTKKPKTKKKTKESTKEKVKGEASAAA